jgi:uncharacterized membrane protein/gas vesicle protein
MKREATTKTMLGWLSGAALGAAAMYMWDPVQGRRRRALTSDKVRSLSTKTGDALSVASRDLGNRMQGMRAQASHAFSRHSQESDEITMAHVRKEIGRAVTHPRAIKVTAEQGHVTLHGPVLAHEKEGLLACVRSANGVMSVDDRLEVHEHAGGVPGLQGEGRHRNQTPAFMRQSWPPGLRAMAAVGGGALGLLGMRSRSLAGVAAAAVGLGLLARGVAPRQMGRRAAGHGAEIDKSIYIAASPETVYDIWSHYEYFPKFMSHVQQVNDLGGGRSHWVVSAPGGAQLEWNSILTEARPAEALAWRSEPGASVRNEGSIHFQSEGDGTRVHVRISYQPPGGMAGNAIASLFNGDPARQMEDDLMQMKAFIETGIAPRDAAEPGLPSGAALH